jgi:hypothetical protein
MQAESNPDALMTTTTASLTTPITIRLATPDDQLALYRLAALDSAPSLPAGRVLLAELDGELRAALSLDDGAALADPFHPTLHIVELLRVHAAAAARAPKPRRRLSPRYAPAW